MKLKTYIVQGRFTTGRPLMHLGEFRAADELHAILQAAKLLAAGEYNAFEIVATEK